jgi:prolyl-tRNA editing enzyme YbaK/EbsC (Cys-tRNA(Pro) deacylase)
VIDISHPGVQRVVAVAARKGVALEIRLLPASTHTAEAAATALEADLGQMVTSVVFVAPRPEGRLVAIVCLVSGRNQVDLSNLAAVTGEMAIRQATAVEAHDLTGYSSGGMPPFGHARDVPIVMDQDLAQYQWVWAAAGTDRAVFRVGPRVLRTLSNAIVAPLAPASWMRAATPARFEPRLSFGGG